MRAAGAGAHAGVPVVNRGSAVGGPARELDKETVRRWVVQVQIDGGHRQGATSEELAEILEPKTRVRRLEEDNEILRRASIFFARELPPNR